MKYIFVKQILMVRYDGLADPTKIGLERTVHEQRDYLLQNEIINCQNSMN